MRPALKLSRYVVASDKLTHVGQGHPVRLVFSTRSGKTQLVPAADWTNLVKNGPDSMPGSLKRALTETKILVPAELDELAEILSENETAIKKNKTLYQVIQPTAWCQLGCSYCGQSHGRRKMTPQTYELFLDRVEQRLRHGCYEELAIGWFGAEPIMGLSVIRELTPRLVGLADARGCAYVARIVTNGHALTPAVAAELFTQHSVVEAEITLDGDAETHDAARPLKSGAPSFGRIMGNLIAVAEASSISLSVRCNVSAATAPRVATLLEALARAGLQRRIRFYTSPVYAWGNDADRTALDRQDYANLELEWLALQVRLGFDVGLIPSRRKIVCLSVQKEAEVLDADGISYNCTEVPYVESYGTPNSYAGAPPAGKQAHSLSENGYRLRRFNEDIASGRHSNCQACALLPVCGGHCPKAWEEGAIPCPSPKLNMPGRLNMAYALSCLTSQAAG